MAKLEEARAQGELLLQEAAQGAPATGALSKLNDGTLEGLDLATTTVGQVHAIVKRDGVENVDAKLLRAGLDAGLSMARLSMKAAENEFTRRKGDAVERLLQAIAAEKTGKITSP